MKHWKLIGIVITLGLAMNGARADLITNGSFEEGAPSWGCASGTTSLQGWAVTPNIDIDSAIPGCSGIAAADGTYFLDLTGSYSAGSISQSFDTTAGASYLLSFYFGGNPQWQYLGYQNDSPIKELLVTINGDWAGTFSIDTTGQGQLEAGWSYETVLFEASGSTTTLTFSSLNPTGVFGPFLDGVSVEEFTRVPEPATLALLGLGLLGMGLARTRRS